MYHNPHIKSRLLIKLKLKQWWNNKTKLKHVVLLYLIESAIKNILSGTYITLSCYK